jgi:hypothetical protein
MAKVITETRLNDEKPFRYVGAEYSDPTGRVVQFQNALVRSGIVSAIHGGATEDKLTVTRTFETEKPALLDALREAFFPGNQTQLAAYLERTGNSYSEVPAYNPVVAAEDQAAYEAFIQENADL